MLMKQNHRVLTLILILLILIPAALFSQERKDTSWVLTDEESRLFMEQLDSLYLAWQNGRLPVAEWKRCRMYRIPFSYSGSGRFLPELN